MAAQLHLVKSSAQDELILATIGQQLADGNAVTVALLHGAPGPSLPAGVRALRVPDDLSYDGLLELIFAADHVLTW
ncbi:MAG TPA: hypothetical protein VIE37_20655 [Methylomirabilota bacterium]|jgi:hypothetical protein